MMKQIVTLLLLCLTCSLHAQLKITGGTQVVNQGTVVLDNTSLMNGGTFLNSNGANVVFKGTEAQSISGNGQTNMYGLELNKSSGQVQILQNIKVAGPLKLTKGSLDLAYHSVQLLYPGGLLQSETEDNRVFSSGNGFIFIEQVLNAPNYVNPGNLGFTIFSTGNLGTTAVYRGHEKQGKANGDQSIRRYYNIVPGANTSIYANFSFGYLDAELEGLPESGMKLYKKTGALDWQPVDANGSNTQSNQIEVIGATSLHRYTVFPATQTQLPLQLISFTAHCKNNSILVQWITVNEVNTREFIIEKSVDGLAWQSAGVVAAQQNTGQHLYTHSLALDNAQFYRLKMTDLDGSFTYSPVRKLNCNAKNAVTVGPNPTSGQLRIGMQADRKDQVRITVMDAKGSLLLDKMISVTEGSNLYTIDLTGKTAGLYLVKLWSAGGVDETHRIIKK